MVTILRSKAFRRRSSTLWNVQITVNIALTSMKHLNSAIFKKNIEDNVLKEDRSLKTDQIKHTMSLARGIPLRSFLSRNKLKAI